MLLTEITDDLTGAADSGSYFTARGQQLKICTSGETDLSRAENEILTINLSSRNVERSRARELHYDLLQKLPRSRNQIFMKKIGTGFRGHDACELEGLLESWPDYYVFIVDNAPDLGTFTLYGHQYCEGVILPKSVYAKDPVLAPTESYIPDILAKDTKIQMGLVDIDAVKGGKILERTQELLNSGARILVFDAITRQDVLLILSTLVPKYPNVFWTGSLGIADGLAEYCFGPARKERPQKRDLRCLAFCASAYEIASRQIAYSVERGLRLVPVDIDAYIDGDEAVPERAAREAREAVKEQNVMLAPQVSKYSYQPGTSEKIMECFARLSPLACRDADFDRLVVVGGETSQAILRELQVEHLKLGQALEPGVAQGWILDGRLAGKEFSLKGGSMGSECVLEKMMCRWEEL